jgi:glycosyltransferase involved in cell wall biosynthesis
MGVPVIGVQGEGIAEHVTHGVDGFLISPGARDELIHLMNAIYRDPERRRSVARRAHTLVARSGFSWADWVEAYTDIFSRLLASPG